MMANSALHQAVFAGSAADVMWLLQSGACISGQCWNGDTPLHHAVSSRNQTMIELLLAAGADTLIENAHGCCCVRLAARMANVAAWEALTTHISARRCAESAPPAEGLRSPRPGVRGRHEPHALQVDHGARFHPLQVVPGQVHLERAAFSAEKQDNVDGVTKAARPPLPHQLHVFAAH